MGPSQINLYKKDDAQQLMEDLCANAYMFVSIVENQWLEHLVMHQNRLVMFLNHN
jgi:hypothetical protein